MKTWNLFEIKYRYRKKNALLPEVFESKIFIVAGSSAEAENELRMNHRVEMEIQYIVKAGGDITHFAHGFMKEMQSLFVKERPIDQEKSMEKFIKENKGYSMPFKSFFINT